MTYPFLHGKKTVLFGQKRRISAPGIVINNPKIINLFSYKFYEGPHMHSATECLISGTKKVKFGWKFY